MGRYYVTLRRLLDAKERGGIFVFAENDEEAIKVAVEQANTLRPFQSVDNISVAEAEWGSWRYEEEVCEVFSDVVEG